MRNPLFCGYRHGELNNIDGLLGNPFQVAVHLEHRNDKTQIDGDWLVKSKYFWPSSSTSNSILAKGSKLIELPRVGGLRHRYEWRVAT